MEELKKQLKELHPSKAKVLMQKATPILKDLGRMLEGDKRRLKKLM